LKKLRFLPWVWLIYFRFCVVLLDGIGNILKDVSRREHANHGIIVGLFIVNSCNHLSKKGVLFGGIYFVPIQHKEVANSSD
jgi:hypothetical protein